MTTSRNLTGQLAQAQHEIARRFLSDAATDLNDAANAAHAAFHEAVESDGSPESMLRVAAAAQAAATALSGVARDAAAQSTVVHSTPLREAARSINVSPGAVSRWLEGEGRPELEWDNTCWWINEQDLIGPEPQAQNQTDNAPAGEDNPEGDVTGPEESPGDATPGE